MDVIQGGCPIRGRGHSVHLPGRCGGSCWGAQGWTALAQGRTACQPGHLFIAMDELRLKDKN